MSDMYMYNFVSISVVCTCTVYADDVKEFKCITLSSISMDVMFYFFPNAISGSSVSSQVVALNHLCFKDIQVLSKWVIFKESC